MITIPLSADALAATRFAVSPLMHTGAVLHPCRPDTVPHGSLPNRQVTDVLQEKRLHLLAAVRKVVHTFAPVFYAPVFLTPPPPAGRPADPHEDLHRVATAPSHLVARQISRLLSAESKKIPAASATSAALRTVRDAVDRGERDFADQLACEMDAFWEGHLARQWSAASAHAEEDITLRTRLLADYGIGGALESLHEAFCYGDGSLRLLDRLSTEVPGGTHLVLFPSPLAHNWLLSVDPRGERPVYLIYPTHPRAAAPARPNKEDKEAEQALSEVIGPTRGALLADLDTPRTTTQLAALHHLSPSTVSYHLARLHRAGLVTRARMRNSVYYRRSHEPSGTL
ncbi:ArsR/SmtB family transcription factor [Streptomyces sp. NPDC057555]|uniref:ArsR/SmtB family transcription factor n=1 Tax=Streptomyces sp. NPDC057555 TaxID=3346166 RepID=UPI0036AA996C